MFGIRKATKEFCATLREILDENSRLMAENESLRTERAKLRELVKDMFGGYKGVVEMLPSRYSKNVTESAVIAVTHISDRMRELGIEVD